MKRQGNVGCYIHSLLALSFLILLALKHDLLYFSGNGAKLLLCFQ